MINDSHLYIIQVIRA